VADDVGTRGQHSDDETQFPSGGVFQGKIVGISAEPVKFIDSEQLSF
jgi:hypothetical protein